jgi:hypothetical protein
MSTGAQCRGPSLALGNIAGMSVVAGLLGALIGISLKGALDYLFERRRELRALKAAARLVRDDIEMAAAALPP